MKIVISEWNEESGIRLLRDKGWSVLYEPELYRDPQRLRRELDEADAFIVRNQTKVDAAVINGAPRLKVIGRLGVGLDNIDLKAAEASGVKVVYAKNANAASVAEYVMGAMLTIARPLLPAHADVRRGGWARKQFTGFELYGKTVGLIGVGEIGHRLAGRAKAFGMKVIGCDPLVSPYDYPVMETGVEPVSVQRLLGDADFVSIHVPLTAQTKNLIDGNAIASMKSQAYLINTSRGGVVNETDLFAALSRRSIAGAVLDVLEREPPEPGYPLFALDNCIVTPHIAGLTNESQVRVSELVARDVIQILDEPFRI
ncbi:hydroxyacid dehydrogenase [Paenibacillus beijingensis]|uniref:2-hydroxyacid dehydrogenase n=1 Tax=Paenibacillus beijingensis TaxID=1126833 RepID=A0A0D5NRB6_9BACL|nr:hydroxyacid dehydrogenase [Paenibacillus beijingensis]AJY77542.1 2-hydroxyacid dehydrogenase [Paenibacillus beijingensis]